MEQAKEQIKSKPNDTSSKRKLIKFFQDLGNPESEINRTLSGIKAAKKIMAKLIKVGKKFLDIL